MAKPVRFTRHAQQKFIDLARAGFTVTVTQVLDTVTNPESVDRAAEPPIAQKAQ